MNYKMEELMPVVSGLAEKYNAFESTSMTYEKAEQLLGAVIYCINEVIREEKDSGAVLSKKGLPAKRAYEIGAERVSDKTREALEMYNKILPKLIDCGNICLHDTFVKAIPEFFKWYDVKFAPQDEIITLDYPVLKDISQLMGVDKVYEFINCIRLEQQFFSVFKEEDLRHILARHEKQYEDSMDNICEVVLTNMMMHVLAGKTLADQEFTEKDYQQIKDIFIQESLEKINEKLENAIKVFVQEYFDDKEELFIYLTASVKGITLRMKNAAVYGMLSLGIW